MAEVWRLSPSSNAAMKRCVAMAGNRDDRNKWLKEFKQQHGHSDFGKILHELVKQTGESLDKQADLKITDQQSPQVDPYEEFVETVEAEPVPRSDYWLEAASKDVILFKILAERLSGDAVEAFCKHFFNTTDLNMKYKENLYRHFFPNYLKRPYTWYSLEILVKAQKTHPLAFNMLLKTLLQDTEVCNTLLNDFVLTFDEAGKYEFLTTTMELDLTAPQFTHHLISICSAYKGCEKSEHVQMYIYNCLLQYATHCLSDWNYGRLLVLYVQAVSLMDGDINFIMVQRLIEMHQSPFKRPCLTLLQNLVEHLYATEAPAIPT